MVCSEFAYYVPRTLNGTVLRYHTSVQFLKRTVPTYHTRTTTKKAYRTSVPYFLAEIEAYRTYVPYCHPWRSQIKQSATHTLNLLGQTKMRHTRQILLY